MRLAIRSTIDAGSALLLAVLGLATLARQWMIKTAPPGADTKSWVY